MKIAKKIIQNGEEILLHGKNIAINDKLLSETPVMHSLPISTGFSGAVRYQKGANNITIVHVDLIKDSDFEAGRVLTVATLPIGYRPEFEIFQSTFLFDSTGVLVRNAEVIVFISVGGIIRAYAMPGGTFNSAIRIRGMSIAYFAAEVIK